MSTVHRCAHPECPGYPYKASEMGHPPTTCTDDGRLRVRARAALDDLDDYLNRNGATFLADDDREHSLPRREAQPLEEAGLVEVITSRRTSKIWRFRMTPLGRAAYRLIVEGEG